MRRLLALWLLLASAAPVGAADLLAIYGEARERDAVYAAARASRSAGEEKAPQGLAGLLPTLQASANTQINDRELRLRSGGAATDQRYNSNFWALSVTQPLFRWQNWVGYEQGKIQVVQAEATFVQAGQDLILRVAQAYFDILLAEVNLQVVETQKAAIAEQLAQARRNFEVGVATITDTHEAQARYDLTIAQEVAAQNDLELKKQALAQIIGRAPPVLSRLGKGFQPVLPDPNNIDKWMNDAMQSALPVQVAQAAFEFSQRDVERNRAAHLPTLDAVATYTESASGAGITGGAGVNSTTSVVGLQLALPLYQGGLVNSRVREALALQEKARQDLENNKRVAAVTARQSFLGVTNGMAQIRALEAALTSGQSQLDSTRLGQEVGIRTQVDVLNAQSQLSATRRDYAQAIHSYLLSTLRLKAAIGSLSPDDLAAVNRWLEAQP